MLQTHSLPNKNGAAGLDVPAALPYLADLPLAEIAPDAANERPAAEYTTELLADLMASMRAVGLQERIKVWQVANDRYLISSGHRRYYAAWHLGWTTIPAVVEAPPAEPATQAVARLTSNLHRKDVDAISFARGLRAIQALDPALTQSELGKLFGRSQPAIANALRLLELPEAVQTLLATGKLTPGHGLELLRVTDDELDYSGQPNGKTAADVQLRLAQRAVLDGESVADLRKSIGTHQQSQGYCRKEGERQKKREAERAEAVAAGRDPAAEERARYAAEAEATRAKYEREHAAREARFAVTREAVRVALAGDPLTALRFVGLWMLETGPGPADGRAARAEAFADAGSAAAVVALLVDLAPELVFVHWEGHKIAADYGAAKWLDEALGLQKRVAAAHAAGEAAEPAA